MNLTQFLRNWRPVLFLALPGVIIGMFLTTAVFSILVTLCAMIPALFLAVLADRLIKSSGTYRTLLIWPYAVAPAVAGVLWPAAACSRVVTRGASTLTAA